METSNASEWLCVLVGVDKASSLLRISPEQIRRALSEFTPDRHPFQAWLRTLVSERVKAEGIVAIAREFRVSTATLALVISEHDRILSVKKENLSRSVKERKNVLDILVSAPEEYSLQKKFFDDYEITQSVEQSARRCGVAARTAYAWVKKA
eukprot:CAMPEP_0204911064 /NCGR_PEP_ID=MMETSP1397-20131031/9473_1 /ASSEMBLY_ACC=CAM_ASM_000891 /TAXON_ID=49980 /ORGANISM="Climacostomum Climacostomum virens, Strain Stock W-24" /LENGTH=151 /DNA_ID=CAMNT_0052081467 /DNA_START=81 /DNA_END=533 /DNA_ORIENTATION=-